MPHIIPISDLNLPQLDVYARLTEPQLRNKLEPEKGIFIAQTPKVIDLALKAGCIPLSVLAEEDLTQGEAGDILFRVGDAPVYTASRALLTRLTGYALTRGILCAMLRPPIREAAAVCSGARRIAVLDGVADATNVGAIIRSAAALSMDAVLVSSTCCDPFNRRALRVSMGTLFQIPWARIESQCCVSLLRQFGFKTAAMALSNNSVSIDYPALRQEDRLALILGSEGWGLSREVIQSCDYTVKIPMGHGVDSLNVAAASAVAFWQLRSV